MVVTPHIKNDDVNFFFIFYQRMELNKRKNLDREGKLMIFKIFLETKRR